MPDRIGQRGVAALVLLASACLAGCAVSSAERVEPVGVAIGQATLDQIVPGETTEAWVRAVLGAPEHERAGDPLGPESADVVMGAFAPTGDRTVLVYRAGTRHVGGGSVLIVPGETRRETATVTVIAIEDGIVTDVRQTTESRRLTDDEVDAVAEDLWGSHDGGKMDDD